MAEDSGRMRGVAGGERGAVREASEEQADQQLLPGTTVYFNLVKLFCDSFVDHKRKKLKMC